MHNCSESGAGVIRECAGYQTFLILERKSFPRVAVTDSLSRDARGSSQADSPGKRAWYDRIIYPKVPSKKEMLAISCIDRLLMLYYWGSWLNGLGSPLGIETIEYAHLCLV